jgi:hypothetical protein
MWDTMNNLSDTPAELDAKIRDFRMRLWKWLWTRSVVTWTAGWCFVWGTGVLVTRATAGGNGAWLQLGWLGVAAIAIVAGVLAKRRLPTHASVRAMLDAQSHAGGLLMAGQEVELGAWATRVKSPELPGITWQGRRAVLIGLVGAGFVLASFLVPSRLIAITPARPMDISDVIALQDQQIDALEEAELLDEAEASELEDALEQIESDADGSDPVKTWEAIDHMSQALAGLADEAVEEAMSNAEAIAQAQALAEALNENQNALDAQTMAEAMDDLAERVSQACRQSSALSQSLSESLTGACQNSSLTAEQLSDLADQLSQCQQGQAGSLSELANAGLIEPQLLDQLAQAGQCDAQQLAEQLSQLNAASQALAGAGMTTGEQIEQCLSECTGGQPGEESTQTAQDGPGQPGSGGISRGPGDAAMTWGDPSNREGAEFTEETLSPSELIDLRRSELSAISAGAGAHDTSGASASTGGGLTATQGDGTAHSATLLPRHKRTVERYFQRSDTNTQSAD